MVDEKDPVSGGGFGSGMRIGMEMVVATMVGIGLGWWGDRFFGTKPWLMLVGVLLGVAAGLLNVYRFIQQYQKDTER